MSSPLTEALQQRIRLIFGPSPRITVAQVERPDADIRLARILSILLDAPPSEAAH